MAKLWYSIHWYIPCIQYNVPSWYHLHRKHSHYHILPMSPNHILRLLVFISEASLRCVDRDTVLIYLFTFRNNNCLCSIHLFIQTDQHKPQPCRREDRHGRRDAVDNHGNSELGLDVHVTSIYRSNVADAVDKCDCGSSLSCRAWQRVADPSESDGVTTVQSGNHQHHGDVSRGGGSGGRSEDERDDGNAKW